MYLLVLIHILQSSLFVVNSCPALCACTYGNSGIAELRLVQCSNPGISAVPINVPADTVKLRLEKTLITKVSRAAFYNLSELRFLWLTYNSITSIHPSSFVNLKAIRELRLDGNLLTSFPWEGLRDMPLLQTLSLHNNRLSNLPVHASLFLPNITYLDLSSNRLTILPGELLDLWFPLPGQQGGQAQRRILGLHDNPWLCDCQISMLMSLSTSLGSPVVLVDKLMCSRSLGKSGMLLTQAELSRCMRPSVQPAATRVISPLGSNVILRCDATGYPTPTLTWIKTSAYTDCCQEDNVENSEDLPRILESFLQESPRVGVRWSVISLNGLSYKDAGEYRCQARNMAGISEAPIKLKVMGVTRLSLSKKKSQKTPSRSLSKHKKTYQTPATTITPSVKENHINTTLFNNKAQKAHSLKMFKVDKDIKRHKMIATSAKKNTPSAIKSVTESYDKSSNTLLSETLV
ncbi:leucine-rich repeat, immunoglobulin-like domain and transmembrane domain-containing protein 3b [Amphiprion ocellaris]|uniref:Ig-like domain-containing protein n=1 Tax=Amphiprion ocellaris TaxID=80972 RepID=A0A3Q1CQG0_AMPOC|nr:leucine-rich repeat, immunoglobulin-like domain and transmembrane domain-containing protein 3b [Amphiprion ocellaris]